MITHKQSGVDHLKTQINGIKCIYAPTLNWVQSDKVNYYNIDRTPKEQLWRLSICFSLDYYADGYDKRDYFKNANRIMKSIDNNGNIVNDLWLKRIANNQNDLYIFDRLIGLFDDDRNSSDCEFATESELLELIKKAVKRAVKPLQASKKEVKKLIKLYK
jgi:hypothetical protein